MTNVGSDYIFHSTKEFQTICKILSDGFKVQYCREEFIINSTSYFIGIPMVSFSDIPISFMGEHTAKYGDYTIVMNKEWAVQNMLNPVVYLQSNSFLAKSIEPFLAIVESDGLIGDIRKEWVLQNDNENKDVVKIERLGDENRQINISAYVGILSFLKNYKGNVTLSCGRVFNNYKFYDEREWRYIPSKEQFLEHRISPAQLLSKEEYFIMKENRHRLGGEIYLPFNLKDVHSIYVTSSFEKTEISKNIKFVCGNNIQDNQLDLLKKIKLLGPTQCHCKPG